MNAEAIANNRRREASRRWRQRHPDKAKAASLRWYRSNRDRVNQTKKRWRASNKHVVSRENRIQTLKKYNLTPEQYESMLAIQNGLCAICKQPERTKYNGKAGILSVDHNHITGKTRDLLCADCNRMVGCARENIDTLLSAIEYLRRHK